MTSTDQWKQYLADVAPDLDAEKWVNPENLRVPTIVGVPGTDLCMNEHNKKIDDAIKLYHKISNEMDISSPKEVRFLKMRWDYVMCYGAGNFLDFNSLEGKICMLNGPNASGKSSIIDVICIGIFGKPTNMRNMQYCKKSYGKLVFDQRPADSPMSVSMLINVDKDVFEITRTYNGKDKTAVAKCLNDTSKSVDGLTAVDAWVETIMGSLEDILMSNIVSQLDTDNFLYCKQEQQKEILDKILRLNIITSFNKVIKESRIGHGAVVQSIKTSIAAIDGVLPTVDITSMTKEIAKWKDEVMQMRQEIDVLEIKRMELSLIVGNKADLDTDDMEIASLKKKLTKAEKKLATFADLKDADKDVSLLLKGEHYCKWNDLQEKLKRIEARLGEGEGEGEDEEDIEKLKAQIEEMISSKVLSSMSDTILIKNEKEYKQWAAKQKKEYLNDPDILQITREELVQDIAYHKSLLVTQNKPTKPLFIRKETSGGRGGGPVVEGDELKEKQEELKQAEEELKEIKTEIERIEKYELPQVTYSKWKRDYNVWSELVSDVIECEESISDLDDRYHEHLQYIQLIEYKLESRSALDKQLQELTAELSEMEDLPFNAECWACQKQPMRIRMVQIKEKSSIVTKTLNKVMKYLSQVGDVDLKAKKDEARAIKLLIDKHGFYNATYERKEKERNSWESYAVYNERVTQCENKVEQLRDIVGNSLWAVYSVWETQNTDLVNSIKSMEDELAAVTRFIDDAPHYIGLLNMVNAEKKVREELLVWEAEHTSLQNRLAKLVVMKERLDVLSDINELKTVMDVNVSHIERIKAWSIAKQDSVNIERAIAYVSLQDVCKALAQLNTKYTDIQSRLISKTREVNDIGSGAATRTACVEALAIMESRYTDLLTLEAKFVGDRSTSDGFREYMYTTRLIPELQKNMNEFLSSFDDIQVNIGYTAKTFTYSVTDRGNSPMLDMASGYQRFIIGLAARGALAKMKAIGHNIKHLFIDEGFTACDASNLMKAPAVLKTLQKFVGYHDIMLMSHSDAVKSCADIHINIERTLDDRGVEISSLKYGTAYPASPTEDIQKKPRKTKKQQA